MKTPSLTILAATLALAFAACHSTAPLDPAPGVASSQVGRPIEDVLNRSLGQRVEFYDAQGNRLDAMPQGGGGSVSVFLPEGQDGQDNYTLDDGGVITRHQRSHGANYHQGTWESVP